MRARDILEGDLEKGKRPIPVEEVASNIGYRKTLAISVVGLELSERLVLSFIAGAGAHYSGFACLYGQQTIAEELGIGLRSVKRAYQTLLERGLISYQMGADGERYKNPDYREPKKKDPRSRIVYLGFEQLLIQANTETGKEYYRAYQQKKEQVKGRYKQGSQRPGQDKPTGEGPGQQEEKPQLKIVESPPVDDVELDKPPVVVPAQKPFREMTKEERKAMREYARAELKLATAQREATTGAGISPPF